MHKSRFVFTLFKRRRGHWFLLLLAPTLLLSFLTLLEDNRTAASSPAAALQQQESLPMIVFLGEGPETFELAAPLQFLIKQRPGNVYTATQPPTYTAEANERVWSIDFFAENSVPLFDDETSFGPVAAGCQIDYVQIEDDVDERINRFFIDGVLVHEVVQGMVTYGSFTTDTAGELTYFAEDSVGMGILICPAGAGVPTDLDVIEEPVLEMSNELWLPLFYQ